MSLFGCVSLALSAAVYPSLIVPSTQTPRSVHIQAYYWLLWHLFIKRIAVGFTSR